MYLRSFAPQNSPQRQILPELEEVDLRALFKSVGKDPERFAKTYIDSVGSTLDELEIALSRGDEAELAIIADRLKNSSKMAGALGLAALCQTLAKVNVVPVARPTSQVHAAAVPVAI